MCYIQVSFRINDKRVNSDVDDVIKNIAIEEMEYNKNGSFVKSGKSEIRTLNKSEAINAIIDSDVNGLMIHHRLATAGEVTELNVHGWEKQGWQFMHNGWASGTGARYTDRKSDSLVFFNRLMHKLEKVKSDKAIANAIQKISDQTEFRGRAVLYNKAQNKAFLFGDFELYLINENYVVIASCKNDFSHLNKTVRVAGLEFDKARKIPFDVLEKTLDGVYTLTGLGTPQVEFKFISEFETRYSNYSKTNYNNGYNTVIDEYGQTSGAGGFAMCDADEREIISEQGDFITNYDSEVGYYDSEGNFYQWEDLKTPNEFDTDSDIAKKKREELRESEIEKEAREYEDIVEGGKKMMF